MYVRNPTGLGQRPGPASTRGGAVVLSTEFALPRNIKTSVWCSYTRPKSLACQDLCNYIMLCSFTL